MPSLEAALPRHKVDQLKQTLQKWKEVSTDEYASKKLAASYQTAAKENVTPIPLLERTLADCERIFGPDHPNTVACRNNLAAARASQS